ncbi:MAG: OmpA family protein [Verrucomicrobia bacterium]|jgi:flagellar motor protein MotB|nr:OmpA family protein [Verrucomicrobiota bacterium]
MSPKQTNWFLRKPDGAEYGPVTTSELQRWATQCRIMAGNGVSADRENWQRVEDIEELEMDWVAHRPDGREYGPFNIAATRELFEHDVLPEDAVLTNRKTNKTVTVQQVLNEGTKAVSKKSRTTRPAKTTNQKRTRKGVAQEQPADDDAAKGIAAEEPTAPPTAPAAQNKPATTRSESSPKTTTVETTSVADVAALEAKLEKLQDRFKTAQTDLRLARKELANANAESVEITSALEAERDEAVQALTAIQAETEALREQNQTEAERLTQRLSKAKARNAETAAALAEAEERLAASDTERGEAEQQALQSMAELRKQTAFMKKNNATLQSELEAAQVKAARRGRWLATILGIPVLAAAAFLLFPRSCDHLPSIGAPPPAEVEPEQPPPAQQPAAPAPKPDVPKQKAKPREAKPTGTRTARTLAPWPEIRIEGVKTLPKRDVCTIRFSEGVFTRLTTPSPEAVAQLINIAKLLKPHLGSFQIIVEGHTDDQPMKPTAAYEGNYALGLARAEAIRELLITRGALPGYAVRAVSAGEQEPPYPNDSTANRVRNRTVVLKLVRKVSRNTS